MNGWALVGGMTMRRSNRKHKIYTLVSGTVKLQGMEAVSHPSHFKRSLSGYDSLVALLLGKGFLSYWLTEKRP